MTKSNNVEDKSWVKLYRKSIHSRVWQNPKLWQFWCYCLLKASHKDCWVSVTTGRGQTEVHLRRGQFIFGRFSAAKELKAKPEATYKRLLKLKKLGNITTQNMTHFTLVTLCKWDFYQNARTEITTQVPPKYHPSNTNKNVKNVENKEREINKEKENLNGRTEIPSSEQKAKKATKADRQSKRTTISVQDFGGEVFDTEK